MDADLLKALFVLGFVGVLAWGAFGHHDSHERELAAIAAAQQAAEAGESAPSAASGPPRPPPTTAVREAVRWNAAAQYQTPPSGSQTPPYNQWGTAQTNPAVQLNAQRRLLYERIQALQAQYQAAWGAQLTWGSQHDEALRADREYEEALKRGEWDAQRESRPMRLARLRDELASCYDQMAGLYQHDDARYASWCRQVASDIRAQRIP